MHTSSSFLIIRATYCLWVFFLINLQILSFNISPRAGDLLWEMKKIKKCCSTWPTNLEPSAFLVLWAELWSDASMCIQLSLHSKTQRQCTNSPVSSASVSEFSQPSLPPSSSPSGIWLGHVDYCRCWWSHCSVFLFLDDPCRKFMWIERKKHSC